MKIYKEMIMNNDKPFEYVTNRQTIFEGKYMNLEKLNIELPDGRTGIREIVRVRDAVAVIPIDQQGNVHLVKQHRPAIEKTLIEVPAGLIDEGETEEEAAIRECEEETGYRPQKLQRLITYSHAEGYSTGFITLFFASDLIHTKKIQLDESEYVEQVTMTFDELLKNIDVNRIIDSKTMLSALLVKNAGIF